MPNQTRRRKRRVQARPHGRLRARNTAHAPRRRRPIASIRHEARLSALERAPDLFFRVADTTDDLGSLSVPHPDRPATQNPGGDNSFYDAYNVYRYDESMNEILNPDGTAIREGPGVPPPEIPGSLRESARLKMKSGVISDEERHKVLYEPDVQCFRETDGVSLETIKDGHGILLECDDRCYDIDTLVKLYNSGHQQSPFTREPFSQRDMERIEYYMKKHGGRRKK